MSEWTSFRLEQVVDRLAIKNSAGHDKVMTVSAAHGLVAQEEFFTKRVASTDLSGYWVIEPGDFVYNKSTSKDAPWGVVARYEGQGSAVVTSLYFAFRTKHGVAEPEFLRLALNSATFFDTLRGMLREGARSHGLLNVRLGEFFGAPVELPSLPEQRRIVDVMANLDSQIAALKDQIERNKQCYEALLARLDENAARRPVEDVVTASFAGGTPSRQRADFYGGDIPWLKSGEVDSDGINVTSECITEAGLKGSSAKLVPVGSTVVAMYGQGDTKGTAGYVVAPVTTNQAVLALVPDAAVVVPRFLLHAVRSQTAALRTRAVGAAQPNLSKRLVLEHEIPVYESLTEQQSFADAADMLRASGSDLRDEHARLRMFRSTLLASLLNQDVEIPESYDALLEAAS